MNSMPRKDDCLHEYSLTGKQDEPQAGYWMYCSQLRIPSINELRRVTDNRDCACFFPEYPDPCTKQGEKIIAQEFEELVELARLRDNPCCLVNDGNCIPTPEICECERELPFNFGCRKPISRLLNIQPSPLSGVVVNRLPGEQIIRTGRGLARAFEGETPGLFHRHAATLLMQRRSWSPPRQALVWAALDVTIATA